MRRGIGRFVPDDAVAERRQIEAREHRLAAPENHRRDREMQLVDDPGLKILPHRGDTAANLHVPVPGRRPGPFQRDFNPVRDEVEDRAALHHQRVPRMMREHEGRGVIGRIVAPPALPCLVGPVAADRAEHVAAQDEGAEAVHRPGGVVVVDTLRAAVLAQHPMEHPGAEHPGVQCLAALPERVFAALVGPRAIAVDRKRKPRDDHPAHRRPLSVCILQAVAL